jgi:lysozyme
MQFNNTGVIGADVSFYQDNNNTPRRIDFSKMPTQGADFVIIRGGQNVWVDEDFAYNWQKAKEAGLPRGSYWFYDSRYDPVKQAELFAGLFTDKPELRLWVDLEEKYGGAFQGFANWKKFLVRLQELLPDVKKGIYTGYYYIAGKIPLAEYSFFAQFDLWLAWYTSDPAIVKVPAPWTSVEFWQWGTPAWGLAWGCESIEIDMNIFNGTAEEFKKRFLSTTEVGMRYFDIKGTMNIREGTSTTSQDLGDLFAGDKVDVSETVTISSSNKWGKLSKIVRANGVDFPLPASVCYVSLNTTNTTEYFPPVSETDKMVVSITENGITKTYTITGDITVS